MGRCSKKEEKEEKGEGEGEEGALCWVETDREQPGKENEENEEGLEEREQGSIFQKVLSPCLHSGPAHPHCGRSLGDQSRASAGERPQDPSRIPGPHPAGTCWGCRGASSTAAVPRAAVVVAASHPRGERVAEYARTAPSGHAWEPTWRGRGGGLAVAAQGGASSGSQGHRAPCQLSACPLGLRNHDWDAFCPSS